MPKTLSYTLPSTHTTGTVPVGLAPAAAAQNNLVGLPEWETLRAWLTPKFTLGQIKANGVISASFDGERWTVFVNGVNVGQIK